MAAPDDVTIALRVNGAPVTLDVRPDEPLVEALRERLRLTGTKLACGVGACGVCGVLVDGRLMSACLLPAALADGCSVVTVEGLEAFEPELTAALREAFERHGGYQCGICTPAQLVSAVALLRDESRPSERQVREHMTSTLCRCTGYASIANAIRDASGGEDA